MAAIAGRDARSADREVRTAALVAADDSAAEDVGRAEAAEPAGSEGAAGAAVADDAEFAQSWLAPKAERESSWLHRYVDSDRPSNSHGSERHR